MIVLWQAGFSYILVLQSFPYILVLQGFPYILVLQGFPYILVLQGFPDILVLQGFPYILVLQGFPYILVLLRRSGSVSGEVARQKSGSGRRTSVERKIVSQEVQSKGNKTTVKINVDVLTK